MRQLKITKQLTDRTDISFEKYLGEIARVAELITAEEEIELAVIIQNQDNDPRKRQKAIDRLATANLRFVVSVAKQYQNQGLSLNELVNEGNIGLLKAAERFDHTRGFKFISYAVWWVRQSILQALAENSRTIRLPLNKIGEQNKIRKVMADAEQRYERSLTTDEIIYEVAARDLAKELGTTPSDEEITVYMASQNYDATRSLIERHGKKPTSYDKKLVDDSSTTMIDLLEGSGLDAINDTLSQSDLQYLINVMLQGLHTNERYTLTHFFGLNGNAPKSLQEIGEDLDLTRERVRQIKEKAIRKLKARKKEQLAEYL